MKKFLAYMFLAGIVYLAIYAALIGYMRMSSENISEFCEQLKTGITQENIEMLAKKQGFKTATSEPHNNQDIVIFISSEQNHEATCQGRIKNNTLVEKKFVLSVF